MTITRVRATAAAYVPPFTTLRTLTSPAYIADEWTARAFHGIAANSHEQDAREARSKMAAATARLESRHGEQLTAEAQRDLRRDGKDVLRDLALVHGFTWVDLARMIGVSVPAIRKWRMAGGITPENHSKLAYLAAFARLLQEREVVAATWLSAPMVPGYSVAPKHLYSDERAAGLLDLACHGQDPVQFLDAADPDWRVTYDTRGFDVVRFDDGTYGVTAR